MPVRYLLFVLLLSIPLASCNPPTDNTPTPPNILIISLNDMNDWIGPMGGHPQAMTPNLDSFAESALTFRRAYTPSLCGKTNSTQC